MSDSTEAPPWSLRGTLLALVIAVTVAGVGAGLGYLVSHERGPGTGSGGGAAPRQSASAADRAFLGALREGSPLAGYEVVAVAPVGDDGVLRIACRRDGAVVQLLVALASREGPSPPASAGRYAVFYSAPPARSADGPRLALALAEVLRANARAPAPHGLGPFAPAR